ncbi:MAG: hypothetical protein ACKVT0_10860 [Planctomycetaceae bacterium]
MPTKPLQIAFWSLLFGFVSIMALTLPRIDPRPMAIIAGQDSSLPSSNKDGSSAANRLDESHPNDSSYALGSPARSSQQMIAVSMPGSATDNDHVVNSRRQQREIRDDETEPATKDSDPLIEIGTIVIPSLTGRRSSNAAVGFASGDAEINDQLTDVEKRLDFLQKRLDHLLASQVQHQTAELEAITSLVDQMQNDRKILKLKQQLHDLHEERQQLTSTTSDDTTLNDDENSAPAEGDARIPAAGDESAEASDDGESTSTDELTNDAPTESFVAPIPGSSDGWSSVLKSKSAKEKSAAATQSPADTKSQPANTKSPSSESKPSSDQPVQRSPKIADRNPRVGEGQATSPIDDSSEVEPVVPSLPLEAPPPPTLSDPASETPGVKDEKTSGSTDDHSSGDAPSIPPAEELTIPVPPADDLDVAPFDGTTSDNSGFKLPGKSVRGHVSPRSKQPQTTVEPNPDNFKAPIEANRSSSRFPVPEASSKAESKMLVPPVVEPKRESRIPTNPASIDEPSFLYPPETSSGRNHSRAVDSPSRQVSNRQVTPAAPVADRDLLGEFDLEMRILSVRLNKSDEWGVDWSRLRTEDDRPLVDFSPMADPSKNGSGLAVGILQGNVNELHSQLRRTSGVKALGQKTHHLHDNQPLRILVGTVHAKDFERSDSEKWAPPPPGSEGEEIPQHMENSDLIVRPESVGENQVRLDLKVSDASRSEQSKVASVVLTPGATLVWGGMIFEDSRIDEPETSMLEKLPLLGRLKVVKPRAAGQRFERVVLLTIRRREAATHQQTSLTTAAPRSRAMNIAPSVQQQQMSGREYELAIQLYQQNSLGPALRHARLALELNPGNRLAQQLVQQISTKQTARR